ncbi:MAG TPA: TIGR03435 family protein [Bryobacteraceae bacterium]|jgi:uncharacterized protein (TIGR03435 family)
MNSTFLISVFLLAGELSLTAQPIPPKKPMPSFEVATVRPWRPPAIAAPVGASRPSKEVPVGAIAPVLDRVHFIGQVELLIEAAYGLPLSSSDRILGGPDWIRTESDRYEVTAKIKDSHYAALHQMSLAGQQEEVSLMEQSLVADRLNFSAHIESREMPRYALVIAKGGPRLERAQNDAKSQLSFIRNGHSGRLRCPSRNWHDLRFCGSTNGRSWIQPGSREGSRLPELPTALQEQLVSSWFPRTDRWR